MPETTPKKESRDDPRLKASKTRQLLNRDPKVLALAGLKGREQSLQAKLERIKSWHASERDKELATARTEDTLNNIRERMSSLESSK